MERQFYLKNGVINFKFYGLIVDSESGDFGTFILTFILSVSDFSFIDLIEFVGEAILVK